MTLRRRARSCASTTTLLLSLGAAPAHAAVLAAFDFDTATGDFTAAPNVLHAAVASADITSTLAPLADFAGNPGRALSTNGFTLGNRFVLELAAQPGQLLAAQTLAFDGRVSASGPQTWRIALGDGPAQSGPLATSFAPVAVSFGAVAAVPRLVITIDGEDASSASGTFRIDNLRLEGEVLASPVPLPAGLPLAASTLLAPAVLRCRRKPTRASHRPAGSRARA